MSENILVVEYEPRYTDRVKQALSGQPFNPTFAKDGEEAMRALEGDQPRLIVLSSVVPKISTTELIRAIRGRKPLSETPILLTVSGYNGKSPKQDAQRVGASDILPKPYSETEFLGKVQQMLGVSGSAVTTQLTSNEIFGDLLEEEKPAVRKSPPSGTGRTSSADVDKMLSDTLGGMMPKRREPAPTVVNTPVPTPPPAAPPQPAQQQKAKTQTGSTDLDKMLSDTLSGLGGRKSTVAVPRPNVSPAPTPPPPPPPAAPARDGGRFSTEKMKAFVPGREQPDRVPVSQPVFPAAVPEPVRDEEPADGVKFGQYLLTEKIATGGMAEVWKARMRGVEGFQKIVAIKKILPHLSDNQDFIEMFVDEAKLAAQLNHNNIIHIYDLGKIQTSYYIAMEYIDGYDLKTILRRGEERGNPMTVELALFIASKLASALDYAHRKKDFEEKEMGLVHRDVSPQNVLVSQEGDIKLCDFGIAKAASKASHTQAGALKGKLQYMSPEQAWGRSIDRRSDIFALATVLFEMLTNRKLFTGDNELSILEQVREARVQPPSLYNDEVTPEIDKIVIKALQKDPANRYQTAGEMARDLDAVLYSFKPTPTSADLAIYMHRISSPEPEPFEAAETMIDTPIPVIAPVPAPAPVHVAAPTPAPAMMAASVPAPAAAVSPVSYEEPKKGKSPTVLIAMVVGLLLALGGAAFVLMRGKSPAPAATTASNTIAPAAASTAATQTLVPAAGTTSTALVPAATTATTQTGIDQSAVDQEVARRMAAERERLAAQARAQQQPQTATTQTAAPVVPRPAPAQEAPATATQAPPPPVETRPAQQPVQQPETPAETRPAPAQSQPAAAARSREGDLVPAGTAGLIPPRITRRGAVNYPPVARAQRLQGTVITSVLVSETGDVLDVRVIRGVNGPGFNEAAVQAMRRSTFAPAMKDGVRVRSYLTVPVEFKL
ncbi:MAG TPA: TonB family protein [Thermoanaerobaculia bacterium]|nr:TonB family protein [Thermoanaerobaculia bacterium]